MNNLLSHSGICQKKKSISETSSLKAKEVINTLPHRILFIQKEMWEQVIKEEYVTAADVLYLSSVKAVTLSINFFLFVHA